MRKYAHTLGVEELSRVLKMTKTREDTRAEADVLFGDTAKEMRKADRAKLEKLFVQTPTSVTMAPNLQKESSKKKLAKVFGSQMPDTLRHAAIPYEHRAGEYQKHIDTKSKEDPTGYLKAGLTGLGAGGLAGGLLGLMHGAPGAGAAAGGLVGGGAGLLAAYADKKGIEHAKDVAGSGNIHPHLAKEIAIQQAMHEAHLESEAERRHSEMMGALSSHGGDDEPYGYYDDEHDAPAAAEPKKPAGNCGNCGAPAHGDAKAGDSCQYCGKNAFSKYSHIMPLTDLLFQKLSSARYTDAMRRYPELLKVSEMKTIAPNLKKRSTTENQGATPVQSGLSGGSA